MDLKKKIEELSGPFVGKINAFVVDILINYDGGNQVIQLYVDTDTGITIGQCGEISRQLAKELDLQNIIDGPFILEVSSPGLKKPLKLLRQYKKNVGRTFRTCIRKNGGVEEIKARISDVSGEVITFTTDNGETNAVQFNEIIESIEELPW